MSTQPSSIAISRLMIRRKFGDSVAEYIDELCCLPSDASARQILVLIREWIESYGTGGTLELLDLASGVVGASSPGAGSAPAPTGSGSGGSGTAPSTSGGGSNKAAVSPAAKVASNKVLAPTPKRA